MVVNGTQDLTGLTGLRIGSGETSGLELPVSKSNGVGTNTILPLNLDSSFVLCFKA